MSNISQRPGVYSDYEASGIIQTRSGVRAAGLAAETCEVTEAVTVYSAASAASFFGSGSRAAALCGVLLENGAAYVVVAPVIEGDYEAALAALNQREDVYAVLCDSQSEELLLSLKEMVMAASGARREKLAVAGIALEGTTEATALASKLNCERFIIAGAVGENDSSYIAAAMAGAICCQTDPALPLNGVELYGITAGSFADEDINALVSGGVTPVENESGGACIVRAITTRTRTLGLADTTWRELTTIMIVDEVIPSIRKALKAKFTRTKNTAQTRGAVRTQVVLELNNQMKRQVIDGYGDVIVEADEDDPTTCNVGFDFTVAHGLNRIHISAIIEV